MSFKKRRLEMSEELEMLNNIAEALKTRVSEEVDYIVKEISTIFTSHENRLASNHLYHLLKYWHNSKVFSEDFKFGIGDTLYDMHIADSELRWKFAISLKYLKKLEDLTEEVRSELEQSDNILKRGERNAEKI